MNSVRDRTPTPGTRTRDPEATRERLLQCAFDEIYEKGYMGASLDQILEQSGVTKGALYHHFGSKAELTVAMIDEIVLPTMLELWVNPLQGSDDPVTALKATTRGTLKRFGERFLRSGCPLNNLAQELSNVDERFRTHLNRVFDAWRSGLVEAFAHGQRVGTVRQDVDPDAVAAFVVAGLEGLATTMKSSRDPVLADAATSVLFQFLDTLRPPAVPVPA